MANQENSRRKVVATDEVAHLWAHQTQSEAYNSGRTVFFRDKAIYSYGHHFPMGRFVRNAKGETAVLITTRTYSVTTSRHLRGVRYAVRHISPIFNVPLEDRTQDNAYAPCYCERIEATQRLVARARKADTQQRLYADLVNLVAEANAYCAFFELPDSFTVMEDFFELRSTLANQEAKERKAEKERLAKIARENEERIERWCAGESVYLPGSLPVYLRIEGDQVVTSKGARFPVAHALRGIALVKATISSGRPYQRNGHTLHLGVYVIDSIDIHGNVKAGCHHVRYSEIARIEAQLQALGGAQ